MQCSYIKCCIGREIAHLVKWESAMLSQMGNHCLNALNGG